MLEEVKWSGTNVYQKALEGLLGKTANQAATKRLRTRNRATRCTGRYWSAIWGSTVASSFETGMQRVTKPLGDPLFQAAGMGEAGNAHAIGPLSDPVSIPCPDQKGDQVVGV